MLRPYGTLVLCEMLKREIEIRDKETGKLLLVLPDEQKGRPSKAKVHGLGAGVCARTAEGARVWDLDLGATVVVDAYAIRLAIGRDGVLQDAKLAANPHAREGDFFLIEVDDIWLVVEEAS